MANYAQKDIRIDFDDAAGTPQNVSNYVITMGNITIVAETEQSDAFGDSWKEFLYAGIRSMKPFAIGGLYDDAASPAPNAIFNNPGGVGDTNPTRTCKVTWGGSKTTSVEVILQEFSRIAKRGVLTEYQVMVQPTGTVTEV